MCAGLNLAPRIALRRWDEGKPVKDSTDLQMGSANDSAGRSFSAELTDLNVNSTRLTATLAAILFPSGVVLDYLTNRESVFFLFSVRLATSAFALLVVWATYARWARRYIFLLGASPAIAGAIAMEVMVAHLGDYLHAYYAGTSQCILAIGFIMYWHFRQILAASTAILLIWLVPIIVNYESFRIGVFVNNLYALVIVAAIAVASNVNRYNHAKRETELRRTLAQTLERLQELDRLKNQFFSNITHELRTPLTMILAPLEGLLEGDFGNLGRYQREYLRPIRQNALKLLKLINDLLDLAKIDERFLRLRVEQTDLVGLVTEIVEQSQPLAARKDISLGLELRKSCDDLFVDQERMERALVNILSNALKFTAPGGHVKVWMDAVDSEVTIGVRDSGIGISPNHLDRIFERFSQADGSTTRQYGGTGIGLALAKEIVELHGGRITVASREGAGSEFTVHLLRGDGHLQAELLERRQSSRPSSVPRRGEDREPREWTRMLLERKDYRYLELEEATERRVATRGNGTPKANRVLVVEDNPDVLRFVNMQLNDDHDVYLASDGKKGLELALRELPDVIVTDYMMPEMDGLALLRHLRSDARTKDIPVIMLTAKSQVQDRVEAREAGAEVFLNKPFSPRELRTAVNQLLEQRGRQVSRALHEQVKSLEHISAGLAHEIHNPLNYIRSALFVIDEVFGTVRKIANDPAQESATAGLVRESQERVERMHQIAQKGVDRIARVVDLVRHYAREGYVHEPAPVTIDAVISSMAPLLSPASDHVVNVELDLQADGAQVLCVAEELQQSIGNLWQNALDALGPGGRVTIRTRIEGESVLVEVEDDGPGIPREQLRQIFVPFFTTKSPGKGLGLGLSIAYQVINQAGGSLTVNSVEQHGTTFTVRLPKVESST
jgi:signal transduction histidine kinase